MHDYDTLDESLGVAEQLADEEFAARQAEVTAEIEEYERFLRTCWLGQKYENE